MHLYSLPAAPLRQMAIFSISSAPEEHIRGWDDHMLKYFIQLITKTSVMAQMASIKLLHDPTELITRAIQPVLWLCIFGEAMSQIRAMPTEGITYLQFITPGILS